MSGGYAGRRRRTADQAPGGRLPRVWQLVVIIVTSIPAAIVGMQLGLSGPEVMPSSTAPPALPRMTTPMAGPITMATPPVGASPGPTGTATGSATPSPSRDPGSSSGPPAGQTSPPAAPAGGGSVPAGQPALLVDNFDSATGWSSRRNDLAEQTDADAFANGGGRGVVSGGALTLVYNDDGWFGSDVYTDVSAYGYLVLRVAGAAGGEERHLKLTLGGVTRFLSDFALDGGGHPTITRSYQDIRLPLVANGIDPRHPGELQFSFWWGGRSTVVVDEIRFE